jgi:hypothetical protein
MRKTDDTAELEIDELNRVSGGAPVVQGATGRISFEAGVNGSSVSWPGKVDGVSGTWTMDSHSGLSWQRA